MSEQVVVFRYQPGAVVGGYSFSIKNNIITLPGHVEKLENAVAREAIQFEATKARSFYVNEVKRLKASGAKINAVLLKREAIIKAKAEARIKYANILGEVENAYSTPLQAARVVTADVKGNNPNSSNEQANRFIIICPEYLATRTLNEKEDLTTNQMRLITTLSESIGNETTYVILMRSTKDPFAIIESCITGKN